MKYILTGLIFVFHSLLYGNTQQLEIDIFPRPFIDQWNIDTEAYLSYSSFENAKKSIVQILLPTQYGIVTGTGFFIDERTLVTNFHVIYPLSEYPDSLRIYNLSGEEIPFKRIKKLTALYDLAVLEVERSGGEFLKLDSLNASSYHRAYAIGFPGGRHFNTVKFNYIKQQGNYYDIMQNYHFGYLKGLSGGPLLNAQGKVIGVIAGGSAGKGANAGGHAILSTVLSRLLKKPDLKSTQKPIEIIKEEIIRLQKLAKKGNKDAQFQVGVFLNLEFGKGAGIHWQRKAGNKGMFLAQSSMVSLSMEDLLMSDTQQKRNQVKKWGLKSARQGNIRSQFEIGMMFMSEKNVREALYWFQKAVDQNHPYSEILTPLLEMKGEKDSTILEAFQVTNMLIIMKEQHSIMGLNLLLPPTEVEEKYDKILKKSGARGNISSIKWLGMLASYGDTTALKWFQDLAVRHDMNSIDLSLTNYNSEDIKEFTRLFHSLREPGTSENIKNIWSSGFQQGDALTLRWFQYLAELGYNTLADQWFQDLAEKGHSEAQLAVGMLLLQKKKTREAVEWLKKSANQGNGEAASWLAILARVKNNKEALKWAKEMVQSGKAEAFVWSQEVARYIGFKNPRQATNPYNGPACFRSF